MDKTKLLANIFGLAEQGIFISLDKIPDDVSKDVVEKNLLYIELRNLVKNGGSEERINEIKAILSPKEDETATN